VAVMMNEELQLRPMPRGGALKAALVVGAAAICGSLLPLLPFLVVAVEAAMWLSLALAAAALFAVGAYQASVTVGRWWASGLELSAIGVASALVGWAIGWLLRA
jgi:vacuolar iron transporter family protein